MAGDYWKRIKLTSKVCAPYVDASTSGWYIAYEETIQGRPGPYGRPAVDGRGSEAGKAAINGYAIVVLSGEEA